ncbi:translocation/assembly module TamB [Echinicola strongylocentroti]|uniref:Translocation/assembly module TamB n=1 Tax=Echinicola strongylocentroti TaxID=1795355 RepID=A0A2Z4IM43_9BACT|nr:translocation/assembly module TamB domain-containing protein [Echinicola strongylocentroti]AWW31780.1 translocation/assembly module TamB [Echinicola strongylocentroti]
MNKLKKVLYKFFKVFKVILLVLLVIIVGALLFIRSPWGQDIIVGKAVSYVKGKTNTAIGIKKLYVTFSGNLFLEGLYLEDQKGDTLVYSGKLETGVEVWPLIQDGAIHVTKLEWDQLTANVMRDEESGKFNFDFLMEAFASGDSTATAEPDTAQATSGMPEVDLGPVDLKDFHITYQDGVMGIDSKINLGEIHLDMERIDLNKMAFYIRDLQFRNTSASYKQTKPFPSAEEDTTSAAAMPVVIVDRFLVENVQADYSSIPDDMEAEVDLGSLLVVLPEADLTAQKIHLKTLGLKDSNMAINLPAASSNAPPAPASPSETAPFQWPGWTVDVNTIGLERNAFDVTIGNQQVTPGAFNPEAISLSDFHLLASQLYLKDGGAGLSLDRFDFKEGSGFQLRDFVFKAEVTDTGVTLAGLDVATGNSALNGDLLLKYGSMDELINNPEKAAFEVKLPSITLNGKDALYFVPELGKDTLFREANKKNLTGQVKIHGSMANMKIDKTQLNWGKTTQVSVNGALTQAMDPDKLQMDLEEVHFHTTRDDLRGFLDEKALGVRFPDDIVLNSSVRGMLDDLVAEAAVETSDGDLFADAKYMDKEQLLFDAKLSGKELLMEKILPGQGLGTLSFDIEAAGSGSSLEKLDATLTSSFEELSYNDYDLSGLVLDGKLKDGEGEVNTAFTDENLDANLKIGLLLDSLNSRYTADLDLKGANLRALGLTAKDIRARMKLLVDFRGNPENFDVTTKISDGLVVYDKRSYPLGNLDIQAAVRPDSTSMDISSLMLDGFLHSNASPAHIAAGMERHFEGYLADSVQMDSVAMDTAMRKPVNLDLQLAFKRAPVLDQVFVEGLEKLDSVDIRVNFKEQHHTLQADINMPHIQYNEMMLDSLQVDVDGDGTEMRFEVGFKDLRASPLAMGRTSFSGEFRQQNLYLNFESYDEEEQLYYVDSRVDYKGDTMHLHVEPEGLVLNRQQWEVPASNSVSYAPESLHFRDFNFSYEGQKLTFSNSINQDVAEQVGVTFDNFRLGTVMGLLNPDHLLLGGQLNGDFVVQNPFGAMGIVADMDITDMKTMDVQLGNLALKAKSVDTKSYDFDLALKDKGIDLDIVGDYMASEEGANLDLQLDLNQLQLKLLENLMPEQFGESTGSLKGNLALSGTTTAPEYEGEFSFDSASLLVKMLNSKFTLPTQPLRLDDSGLYFDQYSFKDADGNSFTLDGEVGTEDMTNPNFDLQLTAQNFQVLNSTREDNDLFYGKANLNADVKITGDMNLPVVNANLKVNEGTDLTFVIPETQLEVVEREGVVLIVDRDNPNDILTKREMENSEAVFTGMEVEAVLAVDPNAVFRVIVDERSGDNLMIAGDADLNLIIEPNGKMNLSGIYELSKGHYEMSLYSLVSRKFNIVEGSTITWKGDPMDANLDITASYDVKTSASDLMATQISGVSSEVSNQYQERLPFIVYLNVEGELLRPQIFFQLDMPEDEQGALGGNVYTRIQQVNEEEGELNRQVFSLLVLQKFMPTTGGDGTGGGTAGLARSSVSQMLSSQLNALSSNVLGNSGFELNFDLDSYEGYQGGQTQLSVSAQKRLFDDRLIVQVGSEMELESSSQDTQNDGAVFGNVNIEYLLTESGRYRLRGFRKNEFESIIDGQVIVTGIAFILNREFNKFKNFWKTDERIQQENQEEGSKNSAPESENQADIE